MQFKTRSHGFTVGIERVDSEFFLSLKAIGELTHKDYDAIIPMIEMALSSVEEPKIKAIVDITELEGWEAKAMWDDFKFGLKHGSEFERIAIYGEMKGQDIISKVGSWFISGEMKYFENHTEALVWLESDVENRTLEESIDEMKKRYEKRLQGQLSEWSDDIEKLKVKVKETDFQEMYNNQIADLKVKQKETSEKLTELKKSSGEAWGDIKSGAELAFESLGSAIKSASSRFK